MQTVIGMIHNLKDDTYHPVVFVERPLPGPDVPGKPMRHKSVGHHTSGFSSREEAVRHINDDLATRVEKQYGKPKFSLTKDFPWDGEGVPALVALFTDIIG